MRYATISTIVQSSTYSFAEVTLTALYYAPCDAITSSEIRDQYIDTFFVLVASLDWVFHLRREKNAQANLRKYSTHVRSVLT